MIQLNHRLSAMETKQNTFHTLQPGQALEPVGPRTAMLILVDGDVLVQAPARWLADCVIHLPAAQRLSAPACLPLEGFSAIRAVGGAKIQVVEAPSLLQRTRSILARALEGAARHQRTLTQEGTPR